VSVRVYRLILQRQNADPRTVELRRGQSVILGRSMDCDVLLDDPGISGMHMRLVHRPDGKVQVQDFGSAVGTLVNSQRTREALLSGGETLQVGAWSGTGDFAEVAAPPSDLPQFSRPLTGVGLPRSPEGRQVSSARLAPVGTQPPGAPPHSNPPALTPQQQQNMLQRVLGQAASIQGPAPSVAGPVASVGAPQVMGGGPRVAPPMVMQAPVRTAVPMFRSQQLQDMVEEPKENTTTSELINETSRFDQLDTIFSRIEDDAAALRALYRLMKRLNGVSDRQELFHTLAELSLETFPQSTHVSLFMRGADGTLAPALTRSREAEDGTHSVPVSHTLLSYIEERREAILFTDGDQALRNSDSIVSGQLKSGLVAPLWDHREIRGVIQVESRKLMGRFFRRDLELITLMANQAALVISNVAMTDSLVKLNADLKSASDRLKETNDKLQEYNQSLEAEVNKRTGQLARATEEALKAREAAEQANRSKSQFLANMSHELRTPLNAIIGYSEMLGEEAEDMGEAQMVADLKKILTAGKHLLELINGVLDLSKVEAGKMDLYLETFNASRMLEDIVAIIKPLVDKNANSLITLFPREPVTMHADLTKVRQALFNLLSNACKFTEKGTVTLRAERTMRHGLEFVSFSVTDTGIGMTPEQQQKMFQPFTQAEASTTRKYGGTGLGLALSQRFARMMGGDITLTSEQGKGSTFTMHVPVSVELRPEPQGETPVLTENSQG
jgi:signal transduction histidine kinase